MNTSNQTTAAGAAEAIAPGFSPWTKESAEACLITTDGNGKENKRRALRFLIKQASEAAAIQRGEGQSRPTDDQIRKAVEAEIQQWLTDSLTPDRGYGTPIDNVKALFTTPPAPQLSETSGATPALKRIEAELLKGNRAITDTIWMSDTPNETMLECVQHALSEPPSTGGTPRSDSHALVAVSDCGHVVTLKASDPQNGRYVDIDFARQLERELAAVRKSAGAELTTPERQKYEQNIEVLLQEIESLKSTPEKGGRS